MAEDRNIKLHRQWINEIQPVGLVVTPPALDRFGLVLALNVMTEWELFRDKTRQPKTTRSEDDRYLLSDFPGFAEALLGWDMEDLAGGPEVTEIPDRFQPYLEDVQVHLKPSYVLLLDPDADEPAALLITVEPEGQPLDKPADHGDSGWRISPMNRFLRLLRETQHPAGLLCNGAFLRLVYAPKGETPGYLDFPIAEMATTAGRNMLAAMLMLLNENRVLVQRPERRLTALLKESRKYQNEVSSKLAAQVQVALDDLLSGFQNANPDLICSDTGNTTDHVYGGLLNVMMRLVFILYAEDQGLMPDDVVYTGSYSLAGLFERLREDETHYPDIMDQRFGAWSQLLTLFRMIYGGGHHGDMKLTPRYGQLFQPDAFPFLEGRKRHEAMSNLETLTPPAVSDGTVLSILHNLLVLDGERLSYRGLDVETIGSVYEAMMGFEIMQAQSPSLALGKFSVVVSLSQLLALKPSARKKYLNSETRLKVSEKTLQKVKAAETYKQMTDALQGLISQRRPFIIQTGGLYLQPGDERRKTGSHYTPRELTEPIVRRSLEPILAGLGEHPTPEQILGLKVCDPAMGSGAFLVETCRFLGDLLVSAWNNHKTQIDISDEDRFVLARRLIAGRCIYGVDKNPFATALAKLSLWLVTLAKNQPFTFLDHALRCGDALVGLNKKQIAAFHWKPKDSPQVDWIEEQLKQDIEGALGWRNTLHRLDEKEYNKKKEAWWEVEDALADARLIGDLAVAAFFGADNDKAREKLRMQYHNKVEAWRKNIVSRQELEAIVLELRESEKLVSPMHWEIEFPEVFGRENPGFDAFIGNPPFLGGRRISSVLGSDYLEYLVSLHPEARNLCDLVAHFFRRCYSLMKKEGVLGLVATNTIAQGDTRSGGLSHICERLGGTIYSVKRRYNWPGVSVVVCYIHVIKGSFQKLRDLDGVLVPEITAFLFHTGGHNDPERLIGRNALFSSGSKIYGQGFLFADDDKKANSIVEMNKVLANSPNEASRILPYIGGKELNQSPTQSHHRYVITLSDIGDEDRLEQWPCLAAIVRQKVKPDRDRLPPGGSNTPLKRRWWAYQAHRPNLYAGLESFGRTLVCATVAPHFTFAFLPTNIIYSQKLNVFLFDRYSHFGLLQSRLHENWARFFSSTAIEMSNYVPTDCFETFPFPEDLRNNPILEAAGKIYYEFRANLMIRSEEGLTKTYNSFHDPDNCEPEIEKLRELHTEMDQAVLKAFGWDDISTDCKFLLEYEIDVETWGTKKKPYRYRWPDAVHDEVLARLLDLNQKQHEQEQVEQEKQNLASRKEAAEKEQSQRLKASRYVKPQSKKKGHTDDQTLPGMG